jgi:hypothetical protein
LRGQAELPCLAELQYPQEAARAGGSLLLLLYPRVPVAANTAVTLVLPGFSLLPTLERELRLLVARDDAEEKEKETVSRAAEVAEGEGEKKEGEKKEGVKEGEDTGSVSGGGGEVRQVYTSLNQLHWKMDAESGAWCEGEPAVDKAVSLEVYQSLTYSRDMSPQPTNVYALRYTSIHEALCLMLLLVHEYI